MPIQLAHLGPFALAPEQIQDCSLFDIYDASGKELKDRLRQATLMASHSGALAFLKNPHHYPLPDIRDFASRMGWSFKEVVLPLVLNAMQREEEAFKPSDVPEPPLERRQALEEAVNGSPSIGERMRLPDAERETLEIKRVVEVGDIVQVKPGAAAECKIKEIIELLDAAINKKGDLS